MTESKKPSHILLLLAYSCMLATFVTGLLWIGAVVIAWPLLRSTDDPAEKLHCRWILRSNVVFVVGVALSLLLVTVSLPGLTSESIGSLVGLLVGMVVAVAISAWYIYRGVRGFIALQRSSMLPKA